mmetsp:Transcript_97647/g.273221  ORF Transcript_97647/g.273221 Transcript_97647/m.273221 type:complete len:426 (-) Transcript_97647:654-1931(-)
MTVGSLFDRSSVDVRGRVVHELPLLLGAVVDHAPVLRDPHVAPEPVLLDGPVAPRLQLPELVLVHGLEPIPVPLQLHPAVPDRELEGLDVLGHLRAELKRGGHAHACDLHELLLPSRELVGVLRGEQRLGALLVVRDNLEGEVAALAGDLVDLGLAELLAVDEHEPLVLLDAVVAQAEVLGQPHVAADPIGRVLGVAVGVELVQRPLVHRRPCGLVVAAVPLPTSGRLFHRELVLVAILRPTALGEVRVGQRLGARLPRTGVRDQQPIEEEVNEALVECLHRLRHGRRLDVAKPLQEEEAGLPVGLCVPHEVRVLDLPDRVERDELAHGHADAPHIQAGRGLNRRVLDDEARPLGRAVAGREGDRPVVDGDVRIGPHAAVHIDDLQPPVKDHQVLGLHVDVHEAFGVQARHRQHDALRQVPHGFL